MTTRSQAFAVWKCILRHHPFFDPRGGAFGFDFRTMHVSYPRDAAILRDAIKVATGVRVSALADAQDGAE